MAKLKVFTDEQGKKFAFDEKGNKLDEMEIKKRQRSGKDGDIALQNLKKQQATNDMASAGSGAPAPIIKKPAKQEIQKDPSQEYQEAARKGNAKAMSEGINKTPASAPASIQPAAPAKNYVGNSNKDVANAKPGQIILRNMPDGTQKEYPLKLGDINWSRKKLGMPEIDANGNIIQKQITTPATKPEASAIQATNKPNAEYVPNTNPDHKRESIAKRRILEEKKNTPYQHMSDNDYLHAVNSGSLKHPGLKVTPVQGSDGYYNYTFN